jgi:hypothetical protein
MEMRITETERRKPYRKQQARKSFRELVKHNKTRIRKVRAMAVDKSVSNRRAHF